MTPKDLQKLLPRFDEFIDRCGPLFGEESRQVRHGWVTFDEAYGKDPAFLAGLEESEERYIGEVPKSTRGWRQRPIVEEGSTGSRGRPRHKPRVRRGQPASETVEAIAAALPATAWKRLGEKSYARNHAA